MNRLYNWWKPIRIEYKLTIAMLSIFCYPIALLIGWLFIKEWGRKKESKSSN